LANEEADYKSRTEELQKGIDRNRQIIKKKNGMVMVKTSDYIVICSLLIIVGG